MAKIPTTQSAIVVKDIGKPMILVRVTVGGLNPHDQYARDFGLFIGDDLPNLLANDVVGVVTALGESANRFKVGDRIFAQASGKKSRGLQEYAVLDEDYAAKVPEGFSDDEAATLPTNIIAVVIGFFAPSNLAIPAPWTNKTTTEDTILIIGGGSNCGRFAVQLARLSGFTRIVVVGGREAELKSYGATHVVDRHGGHEVVTKRVRDIVDDDLTLAFDAVSLPGEQHLAINALSNSRTGKLARLLSLQGSVQEHLVLPKQSEYELKNVMGASPLNPDATVPFWKIVTDWLVQGELQALEYVSVSGLDVAKVNEVLDGYGSGNRPKQTHFSISKI
ncbi:putative alcohol dehydrogenase [Boeremia exigua]|uniref:putative alcohol dehydrogenase n=1 Tax=Boeremia exigua TaxID=749465 RepID=UPI001E8EE9C0|nr:putative alcohol dehydrogenase [Boeremia exigua]KAH6622486.1 putative alcohol dehydrogenase [Boeremia exigua]